MRVAIVTDGLFGDRTYNTIRKDFDCDYIEIDQPESMFADDVEIPEDTIEKLENVDLIISYISHPDLVLEMVEKLNEKVGWIIVAAWSGVGFKNQLEQFENVSCPENMCDLELLGDPVYDEFVELYGKPVVELEIVDNKVSKVNVLRSSPCGATYFVSEEMVGVDVDNLPIKAGLKVQHYPCRASKLRLFVDECKKEIASNFHRDAFEEAIERHDRK